MNKEIRHIVAVPLSLINPNWDFLMSKNQSFRNHLVVLLVDKYTHLNPTKKRIIGHSNEYGKKIIVAKHVK
jgi:hypothetical protein